MANFNRYKKTALIFIAPQILITFFFFIWPAFSAIKASFYYGDAFGLYHRFAGFANYFDLFQNSNYLQAVWVTIIVAVSVTFVTMSLGLALATLVRRRFKSQSIYKTLLLWPYAVAPAVAAILWRFLCHPVLGWVTAFMHQLGIDFNYLIHPNQALLVIILAASWQQFSYNFLFYFAALKLIPKTLLEAAELDGANPWRRFWQIIFPLISPTTFFLLVMNLIYAFFDTFGIIQIITNGGPEHATTTLMFKVYQDGFAGMDPGSSSAQSVILMIIVVSLTLLQFRYLEKKVHYQ